MAVVWRVALAGVAVVGFSGLAQAAGIQSGQWEVVTTVEQVTMPGAPPAVAQMMKGKPITVRHCITPEQAARGPRDMLKNDKSCTVKSYAMTGNRLTSEIVCKQGGNTMTATSSGTFTPTGYTLRGKTVMTGQQAMTMTTSAVGRRIGACGK